MICPPRAMEPSASRCWPKRSNRLSISPACANASRNSQIVVASGTGSSRLRSRKCMNDRRSRIRYSVCSSERIVERLQHHDLELQDRIVGLATSVALALVGPRLGHALDVSAEVLPPHDLLDRFQRIAFGADRLKPALNIEKARLPHDSLAPSAHGPLPPASQIRSDLARRIFRGALVRNLHHLGFVCLRQQIRSRTRSSDADAVLPEPSSPAPETLQRPDALGKREASSLTPCGSRPIQGPCPCRAASSRPACPPTRPQSPSGDAWLHDGFRVIARKDGERVRLYSRPGNDLTYRFPLIVEALPACARAPASSTARPWLVTATAGRASIASATAGTTPTCSCTPST